MIFRSDVCLTCIFFLALLAFVAANYTCKLEETNFPTLASAYLCFDDDKNEVGLALNYYQEYTSEVTITCHHLTNSRVKFYNFFAEIVRFKSNVSLIFGRCPIPEEPFVNLLQSLHISSVEVITFDSDQINGNSFEFYHFKNLTDLHSLTITNTRINLTENFFNSMPQLKDLELENNCLHNLPHKIFENLTQLEWVKIKNNRLITLHEDMFRFNNKLRFIDLSRNELSALPKNLFNNSTSISFIKINYNNFTTLPEDLLSNRVHLKKDKDLVELDRNIDINDFSVELEISHNKIEVLNETFDSLKELNLTGNCLKFISSNVFVKLTWLEKLDLSETCLNLVLQDISDLRVCGERTSLEFLSIDYNGFKTLHKNLLKNCYKLKIFRCKRNFLQHLERFIFKETPNLEELDLSYNRFETLELTLMHLTNLIKLDVTGNNLQHIESYLFLGLTKLRELYLGKNCLKDFEKFELSWLPNIETIDLGNNQLGTNTFDEKWRFLAVGNSLKELILRNNSLTKIPYKLITRNDLPKTIDLGHNNIKSIELSQLIYPSSTMLNLDLSNNRITTINIGEGWKNRIEQKTDSKTVTIIMNLENNPIKCDCHIFPFVAYKRAIHPWYHPNINFKNAFCHWPESLRNVSLHNVTLSRLQCPLNDTYLKEKDKCPLKCNCQYRPVDNTVIIHCNGTGMDEFPDELQEINDVKMELWFANNNLSSLDKLLNFSSTAHVSTLSLSNNILTEIQQLEHFHQLEVLKLDNNRITRIPSALIQRLRNSTTLTSITLHNNPWKCDCSTKEFKNFLEVLIDNQKLKNSINNITCQNEQQSIISMESDLLCPNTSHQESLFLIILYISLVIFSILLVTSIVSYFIYKYEIKVWMFTHKICLRLVLKPEINEDKIYDAFISISAQDEAFVVDYLIPQLENNVDHAYKLFIESRHALTGGCIANQITNTVENSYRTIIVLSTNYLTNEWRRKNYRTLHLNAIKDHSARVIVILLDDIKTEDLDPELKALLERKTLKWGESLFWEKFKYELPHPQIYSKQRGARGTALQMRRLKN